MKKIGIVTFYNNYNYGSYLQSFALKSKIEELGNKVEIIDFLNLKKPWNKTHHRKTLWSRFICMMAHPKLIPEVLKVKGIIRESMNCTEEQRIKFDEFSINYLNLYEGDYTKEGNFDGFIVGSDQVWKVNIPGLSHVFFLRFTNKSKRISYAASMGTNLIPKFNKRLLSRYLKSFSMISVREKTSVKLLENLDKSIKPVHVLDPVMLVGEKFWDSTIKHKKRKNYIVIYFLDSVDRKFDTIDAILNRFNDSEVLIVDTGKPFKSNHTFQYINPSPLEFVELIKNCKCLLTDSFHGTAFSILFKKEFFVFERNYQIYPGQCERINNILSLFNLSQRLVSDNFTIKNVKPINSDEIEALLNEMRTKSIDFLNKAISKL